MSPNRGMRETVIMAIHYIMKDEQLILLPAIKIDPNWVCWHVWPLKLVSIGSTTSHAFGYIVP